MTKQTGHVKIHRNWFRARTPRSVDKRGVIVALAFLIAITALAGGRGENQTDKNRGEERPGVSTPADYRPPTETFHDDLLRQIDPVLLTPLRQKPEQPTPPLRTGGSR